MSWMDCHKKENETPARAMREALEAINAVHDAFGAPGFYTYGTRKGDALQHLYAVPALLAPVAPEELLAVRRHLARLRGETMPEGERTP